MAIITENNGAAGADPASASDSIALGDVFQGALNSAGDADLVQVELSAGTGSDYEISLSENTIPVGTYDEIAAYLTEGYWDGYRYAFDVGPGGVLTADSSSGTARKL